MILFNLKTNTKFLFNFPKIQGSGVFFGGENDVLTFREIGLIRSVEFSYQAFYPISNWGISGFFACRDPDPRDVPVIFPKYDSKMRRMYSFAQPI